MAPIRISLFLKNMVSSSCIKVVQLSLTQFKEVSVIKIDLGKVVLEITDKENFKLHNIEKELESNGFPVIHDKHHQVVEQIKVAAIELIHFYNNANSLIRNSDYLSEKTGLPYHQLSKVFSEKTGITLEKYIIMLKIEKVKELLCYDEYSVSEIAFMMGYSSVQYLSNQFKQVTSYSISDFKKLEIKPRTPLEKLI